MNHKKNKLKLNSKNLKNKSNSDLKSDVKNNLNSNSNFNFKKLKSDKKKRKSWISFNDIKICSYCYKKDHEELHCRLKNWKTQSNKWKKFNKWEICYHKKTHEIKNKTKNKIKKNDEKIIYFNNLNKNLNTMMKSKILNVSSMKISTIWAVNLDWYINSESSFHLIYNCSVFMNFLLLFKSETSENVKDNLIIYMRIKMIKLQINNQIFTV